MTSHNQNQGRRWTSALLGLVVALGTLPLADLAEAQSRGNQVRRPAKSPAPPAAVVVPACKRGVPGVSPC